MTLVTHIHINTWSTIHIIKYNTHTWSTTHPLRCNTEQHRQSDVTPTTGFSKNDREPRIPPFIGNPGVKFAVENEADVMSFFDHYIPPELTEIVVEQTNLYAQQQIEKMPHPVTKYAPSEEWKPVTVIEMKKNSLV